MSVVATWHLCSGLINDRASCGLALDLFLSSLAAFSLARVIIHVHTLVPELPGGVLVPAFLQEGFRPSIGCSGAAPLTAPSVVPSSVTLCPSSHPVLSSTSHHLPLHHVSMDAYVYSLSPPVHPSSVRMGTLSCSLCISGAGRHFWKTVGAPTFVKLGLYLKELIFLMETIKISICDFLN